MKVIDSGHKYALWWLDEDGNPEPENRLVFVKREGDKYPGNIGHHSGTNIQEVLRALIDRIQYLNNQIPCKENEYILVNLRACLFWLENRAAERHNRKLTDIRIDEIEDYPFCRKCGHIGCWGKCHD